MRPADDGTVVVVDDDASVRRGLQRLLAAHGYRVETRVSAEEFLTTPRPAGVCCLVLDLRLPGLDGLALQRAIGHGGSAPAIVFISGHGDIPTSVRAIKAGAIDFLAKPVGEESLIPAVREALGEARRRLAEESTSAQAATLLARLSPREAQVLELLVAGLLNRQVAERLGVAEATVKAHRGHITRKLGVRSVADMVRLLAAGGHRHQPA